jgi:hypothetical protein
VSIFLPLLPQSQADNQSLTPTPSQRNFRNRRIQEKADLVAENKKLQTKVDKLQAENVRLRAICQRHANNEHTDLRIPHLMPVAVSDSDNSDDDNDDHDAANPTRGRGRTPRILVKPEPDFDHSHDFGPDHFGSGGKAPPGSLNKKQAMEAVSNHPLVVTRQVQLDEIEQMVLSMGSRGRDGGFVISGELVTKIVLDAARVASDALG